MDAHREHFEHGADIGVRGIAPTKAGAFEMAALALTAVVTDPACVRPLETVEIRCEAPDDELLPAGWLNAVVSEMALQRMLFGQFEVRPEGGRLVVLARGEPGAQGGAAGTARLHQGLNPRTPRGETKPDRATPATQRRSAGVRASCPCGKGAAGATSIARALRRARHRGGGWH